MESDMLVLIRLALDAMPKPMLAINNRADFTERKQEIAA